MSRKSQLLPTTPADDQPKPGAESRFRGPSVAVLVTDADATVEPVSGWVVDRTVEGLCLELEEEGAVDPGTILSVRPVNAPPIVTWVKIKVMRRQNLEKSWELECNFVRTPPWSVRMLFG